MNHEATNALASWQFTMVIAVLILLLWLAVILASVLMLVFSLGTTITGLVVPTSAVVDVQVI